jgi:hypothetical protein
MKHRGADNVIWVTLTDAASGELIHINAERIAAMQSRDDQTALFLAAPGPGGQLSFVVTETPQQIKILILEEEEEID